MKKLTTELFELEQTHKERGENKVYQEIVIKGAQLRELMKVETRNIFKNV